MFFKIPWEGGKFPKFCKVGDIMVVTEESKPPAVFLCITSSPRTEFVRLAIVLPGDTQALADSPPDGRTIIDPPPNPKMSPGNYGKPVVTQGICGCDTQEDE